MLKFGTKPLNIRFNTKPLNTRFGTKPLNIRFFELVFKFSIVNKNLKNRNYLGRIANLELQHF